MPCRRQLIADGATAIPRSCQDCGLGGACRLGLADPLKANAAPLYTTHEQVTAVIEGLKVERPIVRTRAIRDLMQSLIDDEEWSDAFEAADTCEAILKGEARRKLEALKKLVR